jgi:5'-methylthioadenosine phosphorylase
MVTDYDVWAEKPVSLEEVLSTVAKNEQNIKKILRNTLSSIDEKRGCACGDSLKDAVI